MSPLLGQSDSVPGHVRLTPRASFSPGPPPPGWPRLPRAGPRPPARPLSGAPHRWPFSSQEPRACPPASSYLSDTWTGSSPLWCRAREFWVPWARPGCPLKARPQVALLGAEPGAGPGGRSPSHGGVTWMGSWDPSSSSSSFVPGREVRASSTPPTALAARLRPKALGPVDRGPGPAEL